MTNLRNLKASSSFQGDFSRLQRLKRKERKLQIRQQGQLHHLFRLVLSSEEVGSSLKRNQHLPYLVVAVVSLEARLLRSLEARHLRFQLEAFFHHKQAAFLDQL